MYMSRLTLRRNTWSVRGVHDAHRAMWDLFGDGPDRKRDFLYRHEEGMRFLAVSARHPGDGLGIWDVEVKEYDPALKAGDPLEFLLRVNPVRKTKVPGGKRQVRHDVVQDMRKRLMAEGVDKDELPVRPELAIRAGLGWLASRQEGIGVEIEPESVRADRYEQHAFPRDGAPPLRYSSLDLQGLCQVTDPEALRRALFHGVGPAKAFGCGLMLVKRA